MRTRFDTLLKRAIRPTEPDAELLRRFADGRDEAAFTELVRRYGPLVWGQCRHLLYSEADADDAFQATFLVLARSAGAVRQADRLGPWLHGVAYRVCRAARRVAARRAKRDRKSATAEATRPVADSAWDTALAAVHAELHDLPETLRVPFVLCCLEGKGTAEAAAQLGLKLGTFSARLTRAKQALLDRLSARGLTAAVTAMAAVATGATHAPASVAAKAVGFATTAAAVPSNILSLTHGVIGMSTGTIKLLAAGLLAACGLAVGVGGGITANAQAPAKEKAAAKEAKDDKDNVIEELKRALLAQRDQAQAQLQAAEAATRAAAEQERAAMLRARESEQPKRVEKGPEAPAKKQQSDFGYYVQQPGFAPTAEGLEKLVASYEAEHPGFRFVGVVNMTGVAKLGASEKDRPTPTLVFRRDAGASKVAAAAEYYEKVAKAQADSALKKVDEAKEVLLDKTKLLDKLKIDDRAKELLKKAAEVDKVKEKVAEANKKVPDAIKAKDKPAADAAQLKEKLAELEKKPRYEQKVIPHTVTVPTPDAAATRAEIARLKAQVAELEALAAKKPSKWGFVPADLGKGDFDAQVKLITELVRLKFGDAAAKKVIVQKDNRDGSVQVECDVEVGMWLQQAVKGLSQPTGGSKPK